MKTFCRVRQIWPLLVRAARNRMTNTYGEFASELEMDRAARSMGRFLDPIMWYCKANCLPPLTDLVVNKRIERPGPGLATLEEDSEQARERVFGYDWLKLEPEADDIEEATRQHSSAKPLALRSQHYARMLQLLSARNAPRTRLTHS